MSTTSMHAIITYFILLTRLNNILQNHFSLEEVEIVDANVIYLLHYLSDEQTQKKMGECQWHVYV